MYGQRAWSLSNEILTAKPALATINDTPELDRQDDCYPIILDFVNRGEFEKCGDFIAANSENIVSPQSVSLALFSLAHLPKTESLVYQSLRFRYLALQGGHFDQLLSSLTDGPSVKNQLLAVDQLYIGRAALAILDDDSESVAHLVHNDILSSSVSEISRLFTRLAACSTCRNCRKLQNGFIDFPRVVKMIISVLARSNLSPHSLRIFHSVFVLEISSLDRESLGLAGLSRNLDREIFGLKNFKGKISEIAESFFTIFPELWQFFPLTLKRLKSVSAANPILSPDILASATGAVALCGVADPGFRDFLSCLLVKRKLSNLGLARLAHLNPQVLSRLNLTEIDCETVSAIFSVSPDWEPEILYRMFMAFRQNLRPRQFISALIEIGKTKKVREFLGEIDEFVEFSAASEAAEIGEIVARSFSGEKNQIRILRKIMNFAKKGNSEKLERFRAALIHEGLSEII